MPTTLETRTAGNNTFESASGGLFKFIGGIRGEGPFVKASIIIHNSTLRAEFKAEFAFGGTVGGSQPGTMDIRIVAVFIETMTSDGGLVVTVTGTIILGGGTGGLAGIHGEGIVSGLSISPNYSVNVSFGPA